MVQAPLLQHHQYYFLVSLQVEDVVSFYPRYSDLVDLPFDHMSPLCLILLELWKLLSNDESEVFIEEHRVVLDDVGKVLQKG